jgi:GT2 family glycosyltransferase
MEADTPALSVLVPTQGQPVALVRLLDGLARQTLSPSCFEVIVVDDGSPAPLDLGARHDLFALTLLRQDRAGPGAARNLGLGICSAPLVLLLDDDAVPAPDLLAQHLAAHERAPERTAVLGTFRFSEGARASAFVRLLDESDLLYTFSELRPGELHDWRSFWTCNLSLPVAAVCGAGGFDAAGFPEAVVGDWELGYRLFLDGWRVMHATECRCEHDHPFTPAAYALHAERQGFYLTRMQEKHGLPGILRCDDEAGVRMLKQEATDPVELQCAALAELRGALDNLDARCADAPALPGTRASALEMTSEVASLAFSAGVHRAVTSPDSLEAAGLREPTRGGPAQLQRLPVDEEGPWPLATEATQRVLAWPRYGDEGDLERLLATWAECLASCESACLCLRHDEAFDGPLDAALEHLRRSWEAVVPASVELEVLLVDGKMGPAELLRLGRAVEAVLDVEGCDDPAREAFARVVGRPRLTTPEAV